MNEDKQIAHDVLAPDVLDLISDEENQEQEKSEANEQEPEAEEVDKTNPNEPKEADEKPQTTEKETKEELDEEAEEDLDEEALGELLETGKRLKEYQKTHPGFDPVKIHGEFTRRSQELAEAKRKLEALEAQKKEEPLPDISDIAPETLALLEKYTKAKGLVSKEEIQAQEQVRATQEYESVKQKQINEFIEKHPEYKSENEKGDENWNTLLTELNSWYKLPTNPKEIGTLLERVHTTISPEKSFDAKKAAKIIVQKKANKVGQAATGGGASTKKKTSFSVQNAKQLFKGYSDSELEELFNE